jgi:hypothetical protein
MIYFCEWMLMTQSTIFPLGWFHKHHTIYLVNIILILTLFPILTILNIQVTFITLCPILTMFFKPINQWYFTYLSSLTSMKTKFPTTSPFLLMETLVKQSYSPCECIMYFDSYELTLFYSLSLPLWQQWQREFFSSPLEMMLLLRWCFYHSHFIL